MSNISTFKSQKGEPMVVHRGFIYTLQRRTAVKYIFRYQRLNCKAWCHTNLSINKFMFDPTTHSHASNPERIPADEIKNDIKIKGATSNEAYSSIIQSLLRSLPLTAVSSLPPSDSLARTVRRQCPTLPLTSFSQLPIELSKNRLWRRFYTLSR